MQTKHHTWRDLMEALKEAGPGTWAIDNAYRRTFGFSTAVGDEHYIGMIDVRRCWDELSDREKKLISTVEGRAELFGCPPRKQHPLFEKQS